MKELLFYRIILLIIALISNFLRIQNHIEHTNNSGAMGASYENSIFTLGSIFIGSIICFAIGWKKMKIVDYLLFFLCFPFLSMMLNSFI
ncbi:hypothetical protein [Aureivirga sp. CE67]|uniref:hypothetical protein n=1 Tax=Aureivirga sp. CE67 TaxID=1788983 RepID=UPI0018C90B9F|nr:hypothetical protein [Aureivirga sp. CE67]